MADVTVCKWIGLIICFTDDDGYVYNVVITTRPLPTEYDLSNKILKFMINTTGVTKRVGSAYSFGAPNITSCVCVGSSCSVCSFLCCVFCTDVFFILFLPRLRQLAFH